MKTIETPYALVALRKMAEYTPKRLLQMEKEEPEKLLREIETRVVNALGWMDTAVAKGGEKEKTAAMMDQLLKPDVTSADNEAVKVSEHKIFEIHQKLIDLA